MLRSLGFLNLLTYLFYLLACLLILLACLFYLLVCLLAYFACLLCLLACFALFAFLCFACLLACLLARSLAYLLACFLACLLAYLLTYLLTACSRVLLENLTGFQLVKKLPAFYGTPRFIIAVTSACYLSLTRASSIQSIPPHPTS